MKLKLLIFLLAVSLCGCKAIDKLRDHGTVIALTNITYPAKSEDAEVEVFITKTPPKDYTEIAIITCNDHQYEYCLKQVKDKTRELGGDGIIILGNSYFVGSISTTGTVGSTSGDSIGIKAVAFKYNND